MSNNCFPDKIHVVSLPIRYMSHMSTTAFYRLDTCSLFFTDKIHVVSHMSNCLLPIRYMLCLICQQLSFTDKIHVVSHMSTKVSFTDRIMLCLKCQLLPIRYMLCLIYQKLSFTDKIHVVSHMSTIVFYR